MQEIKAEFGEKSTKVDNNDTVVIIDDNDTVVSLDTFNNMDDSDKIIE